MPSYRCEMSVSDPTRSPTNATRPADLLRRSVRESLSCPSSPFLDAFHSDPDDSLCRELGPGFAARTWVELGWRRAHLTDERAAERGLRAVTHLLCHVRELGTVRILEERGRDDHPEAPDVRLHRRTDERVEARCERGARHRSRCGETGERPLA